MRYAQWMGYGAALLALVTALPAPAAPVPAAGSPLSVIPADTPVVFQLHGIERTKDRLQAMAQNAVPDLAPMLQGFYNQFVEKGIDGRKLKGLAADGPHFLLLTELPESQGKLDEDGPYALVLRVTDYAAFRDNILEENERRALKVDPAGYEVTMLDGDDALFFVDRKGFVVLTQRREIARQFAKPGPGLDSRLSKDTAQKLLAADLSLYVDMAAVNKVYQNQIQLGRQMMKNIMQAAGAQADPLSKSGVEMIVSMYDGVFQFVEDSRELLGTVEIRPDGLAKHLEVAVEANSPSARAFKDASPSKAAELTRLPAGQMYYFATGELPVLGQVMRPWLQGIFAGDEKKNEAVKAALEEFQQAGLGAMAASYSMPMKGLYVIQFKDPAKAVAAQLKLARTMKAGEGLQGLMFKNDPVIKENAQQLRGFKFHSVQVDYDFDRFAQGPGGPQMVALMKQMMGDHLAYWFGTDGKVYAQVIARDWDQARPLLEQYLDGKGTVSDLQAFTDLRKNLPGEFNVAMVMSLTQYIDAVMKMMKPILQGAGVPVQLPELKMDPKEPGFVGFAAAARANRLHFDVWVPSSTIKDTRRLLEPVLQMMRGPAGE